MVFVIKINDILLEVKHITEKDTNDHKHLHNSGLISTTVQYNYTTETTSSYHEILNSKLPAKWYTEKTRLNTNNLPSLQF